MADVQDILAVTGEKVFLLIQGTEPVTGPVEVSFTHKTAPPDIFTLDFWDENLVAEAVDPAIPEQAGAAGRIPWTVNINGKFTMPDSPALTTISFGISAKTAAGKPLNVKAGNRLKLPAFKVTPNVKLRELMTHEFHLDDLKGGFAFDPAELQAELDGLTAQQRKLLATSDPGPAGNRLVTFITLVKESDRRMHADLSDDNVFSIKPNATFAVFHVQGPGKEVALVCFTRFFVFNMINPETNGLVHRPQGKLKPDEWLARTNPTPPRFFIGAFNRVGLTDGVFWNRVYTPDGKNIMGGNTMHGMINTVGCWMLFRNYNFPKKDASGAPVEDKIDRVLNRFIRHIKVVGRKKVIEELAKVGYDDEESRKMIGRNVNHAYARFYREVIGVKYFSKTMFKRNVANDKFAHQEVFAKSMPDSVIDQYVTDHGDEGFIYHDADDRTRVDKTFKVDDSLLVPNVLGFQACKRFTDGFAKDLKKSELPDRTWTDLYIYRADDLAVKQLKPAFFAKI